MDSVAELLDFDSVQCSLELFFKRGTELLRSPNERPLDVAFVSSSDCNLLLAAFKSS